MLFSILMAFPSRLFSGVQSSLDLSEPLQRHFPSPSSYKKHFINTRLEQQMCLLAVRHP